MRSASSSQPKLLEVHTGLLLEEPLLLPEEREEYDEKEEQLEEATHMFSACDHVCTIIILPSLMVLQFYMAFKMGEIDGLTHLIVLGVIGLFVITSYLYKLCLQDSRLLATNNVCCQQAIMLLPEIIMDIVLGLVLLVSAEIGFEFLLLATLALSSTVIVSTIHILCFERNQVEENEDETFDEMDLSQRDGALRYFI